MTREKLSRCFIALELPETIVDEVLSIQHRLKQTQSIKARYTKPENIHLTLKFLGEQPESLISKIQQKLELSTLPSTTVEVGHAGVFSKRDIRIVWVHLKGVDALQKQVDTLMSEWFKPEERFMSHITLARVKQVYNRQELFTFLDDIHIKPCTLSTKHIHLMKSALTPDGPIYETIASYSLNF